MNPKCRYCGAEMELGTPSCNPNSIHWCYVCGCGAQGPICDTKEAALSAALRRYVEPAKGCCWCIADGVINKVYIRTDDSEYIFIDARFCPKCGRELEESQ